MSTRLVLWDLDLTLLDPAGFGSRMIGPALAEMVGREPIMGTSFAGRTDRAICTDLLARNGVEPRDELVSRLLHAVAERCETHGQDLLDAGGGPLPGAHEAVRALASVAGVRQGIVTGNMRRTALLKLRLCGFDGLPDPRLGAFGDHHADRADLVRGAIATARDLGLDVSAGTTVVIGDHVHDVRGALDAGAHCVAVATGRVTADELRAAGAHAVLPDLTDVESLREALSVGLRVSPLSARRSPSSVPRAAPSPPSPL
ncbi:haloacid dehalogenase [Dietzia sp. UCD-THP]|uniref:Haloacid dehalogenase n=1 Tax=Dietzia natronolimnaea TaxID=161920 RepID=A0A2A2WPA4_9ACTN|nr:MULTISPECIES: haloacid dehalogenase-like hydrolase [Dietzia]EYT64894.1 haloacid dehalogenase [Dietzia sp. UCD-THP]PAY22784.1 haloacid dehalogenase [Dietzia natronolimnaea]